LGKREERVEGKNTETENAEKEREKGTSGFGEDALVVAFVLRDDVVGAVVFLGR
jgi:hypothetical protein